MFWYHEGFFDRSVETASNDLGFLKASNTNVLYTGGCSLLFKMKENSKCLIFYSQLQLGFVFIVDGCCEIFEKLYAKLTKNAIKTDIFSEETPRNFYKILTKLMKRFN